MSSISAQSLDFPTHHSKYEAIDPGSTLKDSARDKVVFIAGASRGIGQATAVAFAEAGARAVYITARSEAEGLTNVGYMRALSTEGVLSQSPDLMCVSSDSGPPEVLDALRGSGIPFALIPHVPTPEGIKAKVTLLGTLLDKSTEAEKLNAEIDAGLAALAAKVSTVARHPKVLFVLSLADNRILAGGRETAADMVINLAGGENIAASFRGYKPMSAESILATPPDAVLMMTDGPGSQATTANVFSQTAFANSPAAKNGTLVKMDSGHLLGIGPYTARAATDLARRLHPELAP